MDTVKNQKPAGKEYKSPKLKLIKFFENSRNKWKKKAQDAKYQVKLLRKQNKYLKEHKAEYKELSKALEAQLQQVKDNESKLQDEIDLLKKNL